MICALFVPPMLFVFASNRINRVKLRTGSSVPAMPQHRYSHVNQQRHAFPEHREQAYFVISICSPISRDGRIIPHTAEHVNVPENVFVDKYNSVSPVKLRTGSSVPAILSYQTMDLKTEIFVTHHEMNRERARVHTHTETQTVSTLNTKRHDMRALRTSDAVRVHRQGGESGQVAHGVERACDSLISNHGTSKQKYP